MISLPYDVGQRLERVESILSSVETNHTFLSEQQTIILTQLSDLKRIVTQAWLTADVSEDGLGGVRADLMAFRQEAAARAEERRMQIAADDQRRIERQRESDRRFWMHMAGSVIAVVLAVAALWQGRR